MTRTSQVRWTALSTATLFSSSLGLLSHPAWAMLMRDVPPPDLEQHGPGTGSQSAGAQLAVTRRSWQVACCSSSVGLAPLKTLESAERWSSARWDSARWLRARTRHGPGPTTLRARAESPCARKAWAGTEAPVSPPQPFVQSQEAEMGLSCCRGNQDRLTSGTRQPA